MNAGMKMLMIEKARGESSPRAKEEMRTMNRRSPRMEYDGMEDTYAPESRFRDRGGREHYDNGRYAPMRNEMGPAERTGVEPGKETRRPHSADYSPQIGFRAEPRMNNVYYMDTESRAGEGHKSHMQKGSARSSESLTKDMAEEWMDNLENEDGTKGPHWTLDQTKQVMAQKGVQCDPLSFYVVLNAMYSDYCKVFKKHGVGDNLGFYVDMAKAFIDDKDAGEGKVVSYFENIVK